MIINRIFPVCTLLDFFLFTVNLKVKCQKSAPRKCSANNQILLQLVVTFNCGGKLKETMLWTNTEGKDIAGLQFERFPV